MHKISSLQQLIPDYDGELPLLLGTTAEGLQKGKQLSCDAINMICCHA